MNDFYKQEENSLDVVFLGASDAYAFYQPALAWNSCGYTSWNFASSGRSTAVNLYTLKEAMKTQPDALYVIPVRRTKVSESSRIHFTTDFMPFSRNKLDLVNYFCDSGVEKDTTKWERLEYYLPIIRYHSRWDALTQLDFRVSFPDVKSSSQYETFLKESVDQSERDFHIKETKALDETTEEGMEALIDYIEEENVNALFVFMPRSDVKTQKECNSIIKMLKKRGMKYITLNDKMDEIGLDTSTDYYNKDHTNIHGSIKVTEYLSKYLAKTYKLEDKRGDEDYYEWDRACERYKALISQYLSGTERAKLDKNYNS